MTTRERFRKVMEGDSSLDRAPVLEWAPWWDKTLECWQEEGMPGGMEEQEVMDYFGLDRIAQFWFPHYQEDCPQPESKYVGPGIVQEEEDYDRLRKYFLPEDAVERMMDDIQKVRPEHEKGETLVWYTINGFFWFPRELFGDEAHLYAFYDYPELYHRICEDLLQWQIKQIDAFAGFMKADFMTIAEDMSYNKGPMISRQMFEEFMLPYYRRLIPEIKKYGTKVFVDSDGNVEEMIPWLIEAGVDLVKLQKAYPEFLFLGGFDKMSLLQGKEAIRREFERLLPVIENGKYLVSMDHQTPPGVTMENYRYYVELLKEYSKKACQAGKAGKYGKMDMDA